MPYLVLRRTGQKGEEAPRDILGDVFAVEGRDYETVFIALSRPMRQFGRGLMGMLLLSCWEGIACLGTDELGKHM